jgi:hypothetical protein
MNILPPGHTSGWDALNVAQQVDLIAYERIRLKEDAQREHLQA